MQATRPHSFVRHRARLAALLGAAALLLAGCSSGSAPSSNSPSAPADGGTASASTGNTPVTDESLGAALAKLVFPDDDRAKTADTSCLVRVVRDIGISQQGQQYIVSSSGDDQGAVIDGLRSVNVDDAASLLTASTRQKLDACADVAVSLSQVPANQAYGKPLDAGAAVQAQHAKARSAKPNLKATIPQTSGTTYTSSFQIEPGLVRVFQSFALTPEQKTVYKNAGECLSDVVLKSGISQKSLGLFAGGANVGGNGAASLVTYLATAKDKRIWQSTQNVQNLSGCVSTASSASTGGS